MWCNDAQIGRGMWQQRKKRKIGYDLFNNGGGYAKRLKAKKYDRSRTKK